ncbi:hypothetical protein [Luteolibacter sp. Populi]|uniref:hypothetical protein n=1 Tax=Luteolibacter sp. Populi TaxID=3230487 RepID=UPI00346653ED
MKPLFPRPMISGAWPGVVLAAALLAGCQRKEETVARQPDSHAKSGLRGEAAKAPRESLSPATRQEFEDILGQMEGNRGRFAEAYFSESPLDRFFTRMTPAELGEILARLGYPPGSDDERAILKRYVAMKAKDDIAACKQLLIGREDPLLANLCMVSLAGVDPQAAMEVLDAVIGKGTLRQAALLNLFNAAARADLVLSVKLSQALENPRERAATAVELLGNEDVATIPITTVLPLILNNRDAFSGRDRIYAIQAMRNHPAKEITRELDPGDAWQRAILLDYLADRGRGGREDVRDYLDSEAGRMLFTEAEREKVMATFGADQRGGGHEHP